ncbi:aldehyde dehydrogenase family protein [Nonomuraea basaltis]|uniref:aldehyde dehydrogenase family protein n=1 Tax=Nonomuraea basaltis TaxID=2495887 RepID=UPI00110C610F|nr:aldehyde dehydrogenase family protein [Nonomuraea basaltis]TMR96243.1 aldehyde dehydrogenase [Nonomuraea basaltis]
MTELSEAKQADGDTPITPGQLWIDGGAVAASSGRRRDVLDPATGELVTTIADAGDDDVARAAAAARTAFDDGRWSGLTPRKRAEVLLRAAALLREHAEEVARLESLDVGKPLMFTRTIDVPTAIDTYEYYAALAASIEGAARSTAFPSLAYTRREPVGVVGAITPFNFPLILSTSKLAPALVAGNTVVHKPAEETALSALRMAELLQQAGLPDGVLNVVTGGGAAGAALVRDPDVDKIAFTGSTAAGRLVAAGAGEHLKHVTVELGGKGANIIFADADLEAAINTAVAAFVFNTGQFCMSGSRLLVERPVYDTVVEALHGAAQHVPVGDPFAEGTVVGPMAGPRHLAKVRSYLDRAATAPVQVVSGPAHGGGGFFVPPTVITGVTQDSPFVQEEIFGPVLTVQPFDTEDEAVALANGTPYGLAAGLQTRDITRAHRVAAVLRAGIVWVNGWSLLDPSMPFGGTGHSGYGRENGPEALDEYLQTKSVVVNLG